MKLATRYSLVLITALALLSLTHWTRNHLGHLAPLFAYLRGVLPNFLAAIAIPFFVISVWVDQKKAQPGSDAKRWFISADLLSATALILWEFVQRGSVRLVFDPHDIGATIVGALFAFGIFQIVTPTRTGG